MKDKRGSYQMHAVANQHEGYWQLRVTVARYMRDGRESEPVTFRQVVQIPWVDTEVDQAWAVLVSMAHMLERQGAVGRLSAGDWPGLW